MHNSQTKPQNRLKIWKQAYFVYIYSDYVIKISIGLQNGPLIAHFRPSFPPFLYPWVHLFISSPSPCLSEVHLHSPPPSSSNICTHFSLTSWYLALTPKRCQKAKVLHDTRTPSHHYHSKHAKFFFALFFPRNLNLCQQKLVRRGASQTL